LDSNQLINLFQKFNRRYGDNTSIEALLTEINHASRPSGTIPNQGEQDFPARLMTDLVTLLCVVRTRIRLAGFRQF
jgi:hypothetical protein